MCGIGAIFLVRGIAQPDLDYRLQKMLRALVHRGPDGSGVWRGRQLGIVHRRLAVTDLTSAAAQPMQDEDGNVLSFNGEIYNHADIRHDLEKRGCRFKCRSDSEVLLHGLRLEGKSFLERVDGEFAFLYWNAKEERLSLGRDRLGIKPLYWQRRGDEYVFASEIKALLATGSSVSVDPGALQDYLQFRYVRGEKTLFAGIEKVPPGSFWTILRDGEIQKEVFWNLATAKPRGDFSTLFEKACESRMATDFPLSLFLSGGIDSGSLAELAKGRAAGLQALTFDTGSSPSDVAEARACARRMGIPQLVLEGHANGDLQRQILAALEEPLGDSIMEPIWHLFNAAREFSKVALSGEGADEIFASYGHQRILWLCRVWAGGRLGRALPFLRHAPSWILEAGNPYPVAIASEARHRLEDVAPPHAAGRAHESLSSLFSRTEVRELCGHSRPADEILFHAPSGLSFFQQIQWFDLKNWLPNYGLLRLDKLSMAQGLEVRAPFLAHSLVEFCFHSPTGALHDLWRDKKPLRNWLRNRSPELARLARRRKHPFYAPPRREDLTSQRQRQRELLAPRALARYGLLRPAAVQKYLKAPLGDFLVEKKLVSLCQLQGWCDLFLGGS